MKKVLSNYIGKARNYRKLAIIITLEIRLRRTVKIRRAGPGYPAENSEFKKLIIAIFAVMDHMFLHISTYSCVFLRMLPQTP